MDNPFNLDSLCLILAISQTCFNEIALPTVFTPALPGAAADVIGFVDDAPSSDGLVVPVDLGPDVFPAPRNLFFTIGAPAAASRSDAVGGVRISNVNDRSGRTVTRAGTGVPGM